jgi:ATP-binding cassette, subfamily A (ABC1), member 3
MCLFLFIYRHLRYEDGNIGVNAQTWDVSQRYPVTFRDCITMMFVDAIWMGVLSWYIAKIWPSEFGTQQPFYFLCLSTYWKSVFGIGSLREVQPEVGLMASDVNTEEVTENLQRQIAEGTCVDIRYLYKVFNTTNGKKVAVDGLNLTMYSGQVTALLGHNGAGKVTRRFASFATSFLWIAGS